MLYLSLFGGKVFINNANGYKMYLKQANGSYFLDLWVKTLPSVPAQAATFQRQGS